MKNETLDHIATACRNRDITRAILKQSATIGLQPPPFEWLAVVAFYSAVHYVNAYLWEHLGVIPQTHSDRTNRVNRLPQLAPLRLDYRQLNGHGWSARYTPNFRLTEPQARTLLDSNLDHVEQIICALLGVPPPT